MNYRREIDGLRALAVLPVILFHAGIQGFSGGYVGVDVFFVISGYLITSIILAESQAGSFTLTGFYERRARRILPALYVMAAACIPFAYLWMLPGDLVEFSQSLMAVAAFTSNILFWRQTDYFAAATELKPLLHTWSLAVEEQYYMVFPLMLLAVWRFGRRRLLALLVGALLISLAAAEWGVTHRPAATFYLLPTRGWELLVGALAAFYLSARLPTDSRWRELPAGAGVALITYGVFMFDEGTPFPGLNALVPTVGAVLIILFADAGTYAGKMLSSRVFVGIGLVSYSAYLWHQPVVAFAKHRFGELDAYAMGAVLILTAGLAMLSWRYVERPFRNRTQVGRKPLWAASVAGALVLVAVGWGGYSQRGFIDRYAQQDRYLLDSAAVVAYIPKRSRSLWNKEFEQTGKRKVVLVGDSFAEDLTNAIYESGLSEKIQLSTFHISAPCGNLFLKEDFSTKVTEAERPRCGDRYNNPDLQRALGTADEIWVASSWRQWQAELLPKSVENLKTTYGKPVLVFGRKDFGKMVKREWVGRSRAERLAMTNAMRPDHVKTNDLMRSTLPADAFIDVSTLMCGAGLACPVFTPGDRLISYDGAHLTADGARHLGTILSQHPLIRH